MGAVLRRSAFSPNIKERRDYSCAVYDANGEVLAMGDHMPVHLGSMPASVAAARSALPLEPGDIAVLNDPFAGGTHLPDLTMVMPVHLQNKKQRHILHRQSRPSRRYRWSAGRLHGPRARNFRRRFTNSPCALVPSRRTESRCHVHHSRQRPHSRRARRRFGCANCRVQNRPPPLARSLPKIWRKGIANLRRFSVAIFRKNDELRASGSEAGAYTAEDFLDGDGVSGGPLKIQARIKINRDRAEVDFSGSAPQCAGNVNAVEAIAISAVYYVFRCLLTEDVPATSGLIRPIRVIAPRGTMVNAPPPAAVAGGNVETSQRMVDTLFRALAKAVAFTHPRRQPGHHEQFHSGRSRSPETTTRHSPITKPSLAAWALAPASTAFPPCTPT